MCLPGVHARPYTLVHANLVLWIPRAPSRTLLSSPPCVSCVSHVTPQRMEKPSSPITVTIFHTFLAISSPDRTNISKSIRAICENILQCARIRVCLFEILSRNRRFQMLLSWNFVERPLPWDQTSNTDHAKYLLNNRTCETNMLRTWFEEKWYANTLDTFNSIFRSSINCVIWYRGEFMA